MNNESPNELVEVCKIGYHAAADLHHEIWGWEIVAYLFLGGLVAGLMMLTAFLEIRTRARPEGKALRLMPFVALGLVSLGMVALFLDLHYKVHFYRFYMAFQPGSPMSWGAWILLLVYPAGLLLGLGSLGEEQREKVRSWRLIDKLRLSGPLVWAFALADRNRERILWTNVVAGAALGIYTGLLLCTMVARVQWNSAVLGPLFLFSGLSTGAAFMLLFDMDEALKRRLVRWDVLAILGELLFIGLMLVSFASGSAAAQAAGENLLGGEWTGPFWGLVVFAGLLAPLALEVVEMARRLPMTILAPVLVLVGGLALRAILLEAGQELCFCKLAV